MNPLVTRCFLAALLVLIVLAVLRDLGVPSSKVSTGCRWRLLRCRRSSRRRSRRSSSYQRSLLGRSNEGLLGPRGGLLSRFLLVLGHVLRK